jgi:hypothetical protein
MASLTTVLNIDIRRLCTIAFSTHAMLFYVVTINGHPHSVQQVIITPGPDDRPPDQLPIAAAA